MNSFVLLHIFNSYKSFHVDKQTSQISIHQMDHSEKP